MVTRRTILKTCVAVGAVTAFSGVVPGLAGQGLRVRKSLHNMALDDPDLSTYRDFVGIMKGKDQSQLVSWLGFSLQHGSYDTGEYKYCPHGDWYFLPWHRAFVSMYENAAMQFTANPAFAMPYWDWTVDRTLPEAFANPTYNGSPNPLYVPNRNAINLPDSLVGPEVMREIYSETYFETFGTSRNPAQEDLDPAWVIRGGGYQGTLEATPHNNIHNLLGAYMPSAGSPRDPIFMMHHGNIDRIWAYWNALGRKNSDDSLWLNMPFDNNFIAPDGSFYSSIVKDLQSTVPFGYTYGGLPQPDRRVANTKRHRNLLSLFSNRVGMQEGMQRVLVQNASAAKVSDDLSMPFSLQSSTLNSVTSTMSINAADSRFPEVFALIKDIKVGDNVTGVRVFVNSSEVTLSSADSDPHFVTNIAFLSHAGTTHKMLPSAIIDLTDTIRALSKLKQIAGDNISVQLIPVPKSGISMESVGTVVPASIEIAVI